MSDNQITSTAMHATPTSHRSKSRKSAVCWFKDSVYEPPKYEKKSEERRSSPRPTRSRQTSYAMDFIEDSDKETPQKTSLKRSSTKTSKEAKGGLTPIKKQRGNYVTRTAIAANDEERRPLNAPENLPRALPISANTASSLPPKTMSTSGKISNIFKTRLDDEWDASAPSSLDGDSISEDPDYEPSADEIMEEKLKPRKKQEEQPLFLNVKEEKQVSCSPPDTKLIVNVAATDQMLLRVKDEVPDPSSAVPASISNVFLQGSVNISLLVSNDCRIGSIFDELRVRDLVSYKSLPYPEEITRIVQDLLRCAHRPEEVFNSLKSAAIEEPSSVVMLYDRAKGKFERKNIPVVESIVSAKAWLSELLESLDCCKNLFVFDFIAEDFVCKHCFTRNQERRLISSETSNEAGIERDLVRKRKDEEERQKIEEEKQRRKEEELKKIREEMKQKEEEVRKAEEQCFNDLNAVFHCFFKGANEGGDLRPVIGSSSNGSEPSSKHFPRIKSYSIDGKELWQLGDEEAMDSSILRKITTHCCPGALSDLNVDGTMLELWHSLLLHCPRCVTISSLRSAGEKTINFVRMEECNTNKENFISSSSTVPEKIQNPLACFSHRNKSTIEKAESVTDENKIVELNSMEEDIDVEKIDSDACDSSSLPQDVIFANEELVSHTHPRRSCRAFQDAPLVSISDELRMRKETKAEKKKKQNDEIERQREKDEEEERLNLEKERMLEEKEKKTAERKMRKAERKRKKRAQEGEKREMLKMQEVDMELAKKRSAELAKEQFFNLNAFFLYFFKLPEGRTVLRPDIGNPVITNCPDWAFKHMITSNIYFDGQREMWQLGDENPMDSSILKKITTHTCPIFHTDLYLNGNMMFLWYSLLNHCPECVTEASTSDAVKKVTRFVEAQCKKRS